MNEYLGEDYMRKHHEESEAYREVFNLREAIHNQFVRNEKVLIDKKEKLFKAGDLAKWGSGPFSCFVDSKQMNDIQEKLMGDKATSFSYILPKESQDCEYKKEELCFLTN